MIITKTLNWVTLTVHVENPKYYDMGMKMLEEELVSVDRYKNKIKPIQDKLIELDKEREDIIKEARHIIGISWCSVINIEFILSPRKNDLKGLFSDRQIRIIQMLHKELPYDLIRRYEKNISDSHKYSVKLNSIYS